MGAEQGRASVDDQTYDRHQDVSDTSVPDITASLGSDDADGDDEEDDTEN